MHFIQLLIVVQHKAVVHATAHVRMPVKSSESDLKQTSSSVRVGMGKVLEHEHGADVIELESTA